MSKIFGIDPGYGRLGMAIIEVNGSKTKLIQSTCFTTDKNQDFSKRLKALGQEFQSWLDKYKPQVLAIEKLFVTKNQKTASEVATAKGAILFLAAQANLTIYEYSPMEIKTTITGFGRSDKQQIAKIIEQLINLPTTKRYDDEYDALAVALTCAARVKFY